MCSACSVVSRPSIHACCDSRRRSASHDLGHASRSRRSHSGLSSFNRNSRDLKTKKTSDKSEYRRLSSREAPCVSGASVFRLPRSTQIRDLSRVGIVHDQRLVEHQLHAPRELDLPPYKLWLERVPSDVPQLLQRQAHLPKPLLLHRAPVAQQRQPSGVHL